MGRVQVNGDVCRELGTKIDPANDTVEVDGRVVELPERFSYVAVHKPVGYVTTLDDPQGRPTIVDLLDGELPRLWPVGRLDRDSSGLLLMTNDGDLTHRLTHPSFEARKHYRVRTEGALDREAAEIDRLREGVRLEEGYVTQPAEVQVAAREDGETILDMVLTEGKNRQIRRMVATVGYAVVELRRCAIGPLEIGALEPGESRHLEIDEIRALYREVDAEPSERALPIAAS